jgi:23S rRNA (pseudouridine1915-N3)-methyltransferase
VRPAERIAAEDAALAALLPAAGRGICLDPLGELLDSQSFAGLLSSAAESRVAQLTFVIGGPDGFGNRRPREGRIADLIGPRDLAARDRAVLLAEQLYRAMTILSGHPYHRA